MAGRRPGMKRPKPSQNGEPNKDQWESPKLEMLRKWKFGEFEQAHGLCAGKDVGADDADQNHGAADEGIERQFHRAIFLAGRTPDGDQEVFGDNGQLIKNKEQEQIETQKHAIDPRDERQVKGKKLLRPMLN